jgi:hypothetical protein
MGDSQLTRCPYISLIEIGRFNVEMTFEKRASHGTR